MKVGAWDIYDLAERLGKLPDEIRGGVTWADIRRMKERRREQCRVEEMRANMRTGALIWHVRSMMSKQKLSVEEFANGCAGLLDRIQFGTSDDKSRKRGGLTVVTFAELEERARITEVNNRHAMSIAMGSQTQQKAAGNGDDT